MSDDKHTAEIKTRRFGKNITAQQVLVDALPKTEGARCLAVVFLDKDDFIRTAWSAGSLTELVGLLDLAKARILSQWPDDFA